MTISMPVALSIWLSEEGSIGMPSIANNRNCGEAPVESTCIKSLPLSGNGAPLRKVKGPASPRKSNKPLASLPIREALKRLPTGRASKLCVASITVASTAAAATCELRATTGTEGGATLIVPRYFLRNSRSAMDSTSLAASVLG